MKNPEDFNTLLLAKNWARQGEIQASTIILDALLKKYPHDFLIVTTLGDLLEKENSLKALDYYSKILAGEEEWLEFLAKITDIERGILFEKHGLLALSLSDESSALESFRKASSLGHESLSLWSLQALLYTHFQEYELASKSLVRSIELFKEPTLFCHFKDIGKIMINEDFYSNIALTLVPHLSKKEASKIILELKLIFLTRPWLTDLEQIISQDSPNMPIKKLGESYVSVDTKNR
jgi:tetratricopeptide (TPR) repeat protein